VTDSTGQKPELLCKRDTLTDWIRIRPIRPAQKGAVLVFSLACRSCGADVSRGAKRCQVCGVSTPGSLLRASIVKPTILALLWLVPLIVAYWLW
jgi:hypothetical protein